MKYIFHLSTPASDLGNNFKKFQKIAKLKAFEMR